MKIAQIAPLFESVPPEKYGGTERVVHYLTEELVRQGHEVTLFASGNSRTSAELIPCAPTALRLDTNCVDHLAYHVTMLEAVSARAKNFDLLHFHIDYLHYPISRREPYAHITTLHGRLDIPELVPIYDEYSEMPVVSISNSQRKPLPSANWVGTVHHGLPLEFLRPAAEAGTYLAFLGRISPEKRVDRAIKLAIRMGIEIRIAAKIDKADAAYFETEIKHLFDHPLVKYIGEIGEGEKQAFLSNALALIFPIDWEEPFGLVMIEAMACGIPVIAWRRGSVPEIIKHGINGFIVENEEEAVEILNGISSFDKQACHRYFLNHFTAARMADDYCAIYEDILARQYRKIS